MHLIARLDGSTARSGRLYRWNNAAATWTRIAVFAESANRAVYPDDLQFDAAGNLHILWGVGAVPGDRVPPPAQLPALPAVQQHPRRPPAPR